MAEADPPAAPAPLPSVLSATTSDGTQVRLAAIGDGETWWSASGEAINDLEIDVADLLPEAGAEPAPASRPALGGNPYGPPAGNPYGYVGPGEPRVVVVDLVGPAVAGEAMPSLEVSASLSDENVRITPIEGGRRIVFGGRARRSSPNTLSPIVVNVRLGVGELTPVDSTFYSLHRLRVPGNNGEPRDLVQVTRNYDVPAHAGAGPIMLAVRHGDDVARPTAPPQGSDARLFAFDAPLPEDATVDVFEQGSETVRFDMLPPIAGYEGPRPTVTVE